MWPITAILLLLCICIFLLWSTNQNQRAWNEAEQRCNTLRLGMAIYEFHYRFGRLPTSNHDLQLVMPRRRDMLYRNPYSGECQVFNDMTDPGMRRMIGDIRFQYHPPRDGHGETVLIAGCDQHGECLLETWIPMNAVNEA